MIRQPTPASALYRWHRAAVSGDAPPRHDGQPECGWFKTRMVKNGPWVAVEIKVSREIDIETGELVCDERLVAVVNGNTQSPEETKNLWTSLRPITREEYLALFDLIRRNPAMHNPYRKINPGEVK